MKATDQLKAEHEGIRVMLKVLEQICIKLESGEEVDSNQLAKIIEFFKVFVDRCHHGKEEDLLFPAMEAAGIPKEGGPLGQMLMEHDHGRGYVRGMSDAIQDFGSGNPGATVNFVRNARGYIEMLESHTQKENMVLFSMADSRLSEDRQQELCEEFEHLEEHKIGLGKHEEFHKLLDQLSETYLH